MVLGTPRSGSTWLTEVIGNWPGFGAVNEPLHPKFVAPRSLHLRSRTFLSAADDAPALEQYLRTAMIGDVVRPFALAFGDPSEPWRVDRWVSKVVHGSGLTGWIAKHLPEPWYIGLLRHPCAVIASQRQMNMISSKLFEDARGQFVQVWPELATALDSIDSEVARYAACWCMDTFALTSCDKPPRFRLVCYEDLVAESDAAFASLADWIGASTLDGGMRGVSCPSASTKDPVLDGAAQLGKWQDRLSPNEIDDVFSVVDAFGLDFYRRDSLEPVHEAIRGLTIGTSPPQC